MHSEVTYIYDAANAFRAPGSAALTATGVVGTVALDKLVNVRPSSQRNKLGARGYDIVIAVQTIKTSAGDEVYTLRLETGVAGAPATVVGSVVVTAPGQYVICLDARTIEKLDANHEVLELNMTAAGTAPSIKFTAWLV
jgi:hypothetical protein